MPNLTSEQKESLKRVLNICEMWLDHEYELSDFWLDFYRAEDEANGLYPGYVGADKDEDGDLFMDWWYNRASADYNLCKTIIEEAKND